MDRFSEIRATETPFTWDYQWTFACLMRAGLCITPNSTLVSNIGFGPEATHTKNSGSWLANLTTKAIEFPLCHPSEIKQDRVADALTEKNVYRIGVVNDILWRINKILRGNIN